MKHLLLLISIFLFATSLVYSQQYEDVVYLKNGSEIHGTIIEQIPNESIKIKTKDGNIFVYKMEEIEKMTKQEIKEKSERSETPPTLKLKQGANYSGFGIRGGIGTDITGGLGFGVGVFYVLVPSLSSSPNWDLGLDIYYADVTETETDPHIKYEDNTKLLIFILRSNSLFFYHPNKMGVYFLAGAGFVFSSISWKETITYDPAWYATNGPEIWDDDIFAVGNVLNLGVGLTFAGGLETRFETPLLIFYSTPGYKNRSAGTVAPTFTLNVLYRFP